MRHSDMAGKSVLFFTISILLAGCTTVDVIRDKAIRIDGQAHYYNSDGEIELTQAEMESLEAQGRLVRIKHVSPDGSLTIDPDEKSKLVNTSGPKTVAGNSGPSAAQPITVHVEAGSLKENLRRVAGQHGWFKINWFLPVDYYVDKAYSVTGDDFESVVMKVVDRFPVYVSFDEKDYSLSITPRASLK
jgi:hypothetical protein